MSGLVLKIAPGERFIVNGAVLENGDKPARIRITDSDVRVLRCRDALRPAIDDECAKLLDVFKAIDPELIPTLRSMISRGNYYSALCHLRQILIFESQLLARISKSPAELETAKVA